METHPIQGLMETSMQSLREMVDGNTVLGDAIVAKDGSTVVPVSRLSFGFAAGGGEYTGKNSSGAYPFAGGAGAGISLEPVGFLVCGEDAVRVLPAQTRTPAERAIDLLPELLAQVKRLAERIGAGSPEGRVAEEPAGRQGASAPG